MLFFIIYFSLECNSISSNRKAKILYAYHVDMLLLKDVLYEVKKGKQRQFDTKNKIANN